MAAVVGLREASGFTLNRPPLSHRDGCLLFFSTWHNTCLPLTDSRFCGCSFWLRPSCFIRYPSWRVISCCHISYEGPLRNIWIFHLSVEWTAGSLREHNRQSTVMTLARFCACGVNPPMVKTCMLKVVSRSQEGRESTIFWMIFLLSFSVSWPVGRLFFRTALLIRRIEH